MKIFSWVVLFAMSSTVAAADDDLEPWPQVGEGEVRWVFRVPALEREQDFKVEIRVGKEIEVDCNKVILGGSLARETIQGWGYPLYRISQIGPGASTLMACPENEPATLRFVAVQGEGFLQRYNSKLPYVVYVPDGFEVRYRVWTAGEESEAHTE
jgi:ecotin